MGNKVMSFNILRGAAVVLIGMTATLGWAEGNPLTSEALAYVEYCSTDYGNASTSIMTAAEDNSCTVIRTTDDWNRFAAQVAAGQDFSGQIVRLGADIEVSEMVGKVNGYKLVKGFNGTFDGCGHTLTVQINDVKKHGVAPFNYINGATIKNVNVAGEVHGGSHFAAGLVGFVKGTGNFIQNCQVRTNVSGSDYIGGIVGNALTSDLFVEDCVFGGLLQGGKSRKGALVGWGVSGGTKMVNGCLYLAQEAQDTEALDLVQKLDGDMAVTNCYKTTAAGAEGIQVFTSMQHDICKKISLFGSDYYAQCEVKGLADFYDYKYGEPIETKVIVTCAGLPLVEGQDYTLVIKNSKDKTVDVVKDEDVYEMIVTPSNDQFLGNVTSFFRVAYCPDHFNYNTANDDKTLQTNRK